MTERIRGQERDHRKEIRREAQRRGARKAPQIDPHGVAPLLDRFLQRVAAANGVLHVSFDVDFLDADIAPGGSSCHSGAYDHLHEIEAIGIAAADADADYLVSGKTDCNRHALFSTRSVGLFPTWRRRSDPHVQCNEDTEDGAM